MKHRFRFIAARDGDFAWRLSAEETHHLTKVVKLGVGAQVEVTDGAGAWAAGIVSRLTKSEALVEAEAAVIEPAPAWRVGIALGALRPSSVDELLAPLTELGLDRFIIFQQVEQAKTRLTDGVHDRWKRILVNAMKQCKRARMPELMSFPSLVDSIDWMSSWGGRGRDEAPSPTARLYADGGGTRTLLDAASSHDGSSDVWIVIGSEKGLDTGELEALRSASFEPVSLGPFALRAQTAAYAAAACLALHRAARSSKISSV